MAEAAVVTADALRQWGSQVFQKVGVPAEQADRVAEILVESNLRGVDTHGIYLANLYARRLMKGLMNPTPNIKFEKRRAGVGVLDGDFGLGQWATYQASLRAIELAREAGVGVVAVKNSNHFGAAAYYTILMAQHDCIGTASATSYRSAVARSSSAPTRSRSACRLKRPPGSAWTWLPARLRSARFARQPRPARRYRRTGRSIAKAGP